MIAMALSCKPRLLIADEPTTALDVTIQAQILELIKSLQQEIGMSVMMITHDLGVIAETANDVAVMYLGDIVELADVSDPVHGGVERLPECSGLATIPGRSAGSACRKPGHRREQPHLAVQGARRGLGRRSEPARDADVRLVVSRAHTRAGVTSAEPLLSGETRVRGWFQPEQSWVLIPPNRPGFKLIRGFRSPMCV